MAFSEQPGGVRQRYALRVACLGEPEVDYPVTLFQDHPDLAPIADQETAALEHSP